MGMKQAPSLSKCCIRKLAEEVQKTDMGTAQQMDQLIYFDDITLGLYYEEAFIAYAQGGDEEVLARLVKRIKVVNTMLENHNLPVKIWMSPCCPKIHEMVTGKPAKAVDKCSTLGLQWNLSTDFLSWDKDPCLNLGPLKWGVKKEEFDLYDHTQVEAYLRKRGSQKDDSYRSQSHCLIQ